MSVVGAVAKIKLIIIFGLNFQMHANLISYFLHDRKAFGSPSPYNFFEVNRVFLTMWLFEHILKCFMTEQFLDFFRMDLESKRDFYEFFVSGPHSTADCLNVIEDDANRLSKFLLVD